MDRGHGQDGIPTEEEELMSEQTAIKSASGRWFIVPYNISDSASLDGMPSGDTETAAWQAFHEKQKGKVDG